MFVGSAQVETLVGLDRWLARDLAAPLIVAFSGGGDSLALLLMAQAWAAPAGRRLIAATVDHGLQPVGAEWARWCAARAGRLGVEHRTLVWEGDKPIAGLPAAARLARHALLADLARAEGAAAVLMAHTADDVLEARRMRETGASTPTPRPWAPSPVWPAGRGVFVSRPLLERRRADLRAWLAQRGETWIEDPANNDPRFARARARAELARAVTAQIVPHPPAETQFGTSMAADLAGALTFRRHAFAKEGACGPAARALSAALLSASGGARPPRREAVLRLLARLAEGARFSATLAGARLCAEDDRIVICRESGAFRRFGGGPQPLAPGQPLVWDGRFELRTDQEGLAVRPLAGLAARLPKTQRAALANFPSAARPSLPAIVDQAGLATCPILAQEPLASVRGLVEARFLAAVGAIGDETTLWRVAKTTRTS